MLKSFEKEEKQNKTKKNHLNKGGGIQHNMG